MNLDIGSLMGLDGVPLAFAVVMALLTPPLVSLLKYEKASPAVQSYVFWGVCLVGSAVVTVASALQAKDNFDDAGRFVGDWGKILIAVAVMAQIVYRAFWKPIGADAAVAAGGAKIGQGSAPPPLPDNAQELHEETGTLPPPTDVTSTTPPVIYPPQHDEGRT